MLSVLRNKNIKIILNYVLGPIVFIILAFSIYRQVQRQPDWEVSMVQLQHVFTGNLKWLLLLALALMLVNWGLEARKWQLALRNLQHLGFLKAFKATFTGSTMASFTPNRTGEYVGRILYIQEGKRLQAISLTLICSMAQLQITLYAGLIGLWFFKRSFGSVVDDPYSDVLWMNMLFYGVLAAAVLLTIFYFRLSWLIKLIHRWGVAPNFVRYITVLEECNATILLRILSLSGMRYLVFALQYYLLFTVFGVEVNWWQTLQSVSVLFLVLAILPSFTFLTDLGIRWKAGIEIVQLYSSNTVGIFAAAFTIWLVNLIIPALIGSLLILGIRVFKR
ncbi:MAG TPA: lysylphosphatidylglycerol synthase domain-containing protein [Chitinophagaceae bacterium]|nr:lysylphosphatidylglycerol synthase domain-containing protein [Chitinophagaceae bacterium]